MNMTVKTEDDVDSRPYLKLELDWHNAAAKVKGAFDGFDLSYTQPVLEGASSAFKLNPVGAIFVAILTALAFFPVLAFTAFSAFILVSTLLLATGGALLFSGATIFVAGLLLFGLISALVLFALLSTSFLLSSYLAARLLFLTVAHYHILAHNERQAHDRGGVHATPVMRAFSATREALPIWLAEVRTLALRTLVLPTAANRAKAARGEWHDHGEPEVTLEDVRGRSGYVYGGGMFARDAQQHANGSEPGSESSEPVVVEGTGKLSG